MHQGKPVVLKLLPHVDVLLSTNETSSNYIIMFGKQFISGYTEACPGVMRWIFLHEIAHIKHNDNLRSTMLAALYAKNSALVTALVQPKDLPLTATNTIRMLTENHRDFLNDALFAHYKVQEEHRADLYGIQHLPSNEELLLRQIDFESRCEDCEVRTNNPAYASYCTLNEWCLDEMRTRGI